MAEEHLPELTPLGGMAEESFEALGDSFRGDRLLAAGVGVGAAFVLAGAAGTGASACLLRNSLVSAAMLGLVAGFFVYAGLLVTYGALARMAMAERHGLEVTLGKAFGFALRRSHVLIGMPLFVLVVAVGAAALGAYIGAAVSASQTAGAGLAPIAMVVLFVLNLLLVTGVLLSHCLTGPCVACLDASLATVASRLARIAYERLGAFYARQAAAGVIAGLPLALLTGLIFLSAFQPALTSTAAGRARALAERKAEEGPARAPALPSVTPRPSAQEEERDWVERLRGWASWAADIGGAPLMSAAAVLTLLLGMFPLIYAASVQSGIYLALTGDRFVALPESAEEPAAAAPVRRPPIVHCWRCDAINRYESEQCAKCGAALLVCPHCFATNEPERVDCSSCGRPIAQERGSEGTAAGQ